MAIRRRRRNRDKESPASFLKEESKQIIEGITLHNDDDQEEERLSKSPSKRARGSESMSSSTPCLLGLQRLGGTRVIPLSVGNLLGRNPKKPIPNHVDLGIDKENDSADQISRKVCQVSKLTSSKLTLEILGECKNPTRIVSYIRQGKTFHIKSDQEQIELQEGDVFVIHRLHQFRVMPVTTRSNSKTQSSVPSESTRSKQVLVPPAPENAGGKLRRSARANANRFKNSSSPDRSSTRERSKVSVVSNPVQAKSKRTLYKAATKSLKKSIVDARTAKGENIDEDEQASRSVSRRRIIVLPPGVKPFRPNSRVFGLSSAECTRPSITTVPKREQEAKTLTNQATSDVETKIKASNAPSGQLKNDSDFESDSDEEEMVAGPREMHISLARTYWKSLNSSMPHMGAGFLQILLTQDKLPTAQLCQDLVHLMTFGPQYQSHPFYDGYRMNMAWQYIDALIEKYPTLMTDKFTSAAGKEYWQDVMDQLRTLTYEDNVSSDESILQSLKLHSFSLKLFELLLSKSLERTSSASVSPPLLQYMEEYDGKAVCKMVSQTMANFFVQHGYRLCEGSSSASFFPVVSVITDRLATIVVLLLKRFCRSDDDPMGILWNAMDTQLRSSSSTKTGHRNTKKWKLQLKLYWVLKFEKEEFRQSLAKKVGIYKEYKQFVGL